MKHNLPLTLWLLSAFWITGCLFPSEQAGGTGVGDPTIARVSISRESDKTPLAKGPAAGKVWYLVDAAGTRFTANNVIMQGFGMELALPSDTKFDIGEIQQRNNTQLELFAQSCAEFDSRMDCAIYEEIKGNTAMVEKDRIIIHSWWNIANISSARPIYKVPSNYGLLKQVVIPTGTYHQFTLGMESANQVFFNNSEAPNVFVILEGAFSYQDTVANFLFGLNFKEGLRFRNPAGVGVEKGGAHTFECVLNMGQWLKGVDINRMLDDSLLYVDPLLNSLNILEWDVSHADRAPGEAAFIQAVKENVSNAGVF